MHFASDNTSPVPPQILDALIAANHGYPALHTKRSSRPLPPKAAPFHREDN